MLWVALKDADDEVYVAPAWLTETWSVAPRQADGSVAAVSRSVLRVLWDSSSKPNTSPERCVAHKEIEQPSPPTELELLAGEGEDESND